MAAEPTRRFVGEKSAAVVTIMQAMEREPGWLMEPHFYFACWACGNCSKHSTDEGAVIARALEHLEDHEDNGPYDA